MTKKKADRTRKTFDPSLLIEFSIYDPRGAKWHSAYVTPIDSDGRRGEPIYLYDDGAAEIAELHEALVPLNRMMLSALKKYFAGRAATP